MKQHVIDGVVVGTPVKLNSEELEVVTQITVTYL